MKHPVISFLQKVIFILFFLALDNHCISQNIKVKRLDGNPIITGDMLKGDKGKNINGPSMIKVPSWVQSPLGKYYLYFAHHHGKYIRMAYADDLKGPWKIYASGVIKTDQVDFMYQGQHIPHITHVASPDVIIDSVNRQINMYFHLHAISKKIKEKIPQVTLRAVSKNGVDFVPEQEILGNSYFRVFRWNDQFYAIAKGGGVYRSSNGSSDFIEGPNPFLNIGAPSEIRHVAVYRRKDTLFVFYSRIGEMEEHIEMSKIMLNNNWNTWKASAPVTVLRPKFNYEGVNLLLKKSTTGSSDEPVRQLRDPAIFADNGDLYLLYSIAGEKGIGIARISDLN